MGEVWPSLRMGSADQESMIKESWCDGQDLKCLMFKKNSEKEGKKSNLESVGNRELAS